MALMRLRRARPVNTVIVGAGVAGRLVLEEIHRRSYLNYIVRGFVDDNLELHGKSVGGIRVLGASKDLPRLKDEYDLEEAIIAMPSVEGQSVRKIVDICRRTGLVTQIIPGAVDVLTGRATVSAARPVRVEDLIRRETVVLSDEVKSHFAGKTVLLTGAAGSIGSELGRSLAVLGVRTLVLFDIDENGIFELDLELRSTSDDSTVRPIVGSVTDETKVSWALETFRPNIVFHTAARKHVPLMEIHPEEAVETNVRGTKTIAEASLAHDVETFVHISTDKAVNPLSVMGATKQLSELLVQDFSRRSGATRFVTVRFGNVIGTRGSVLDVFRRQLAGGDPITITDPDMTRFFMTANEAAVLLLQSVVIGHPGDILVLDMGDPVRIGDLARDLIALSGYGSEDDVDIKSIGARPGEKLHESLHADDETLASTKHPRILRVSTPRQGSIRDADLTRLFAAARAMDRPKIVRILREVLPRYTPANSTGENA